MKLLTCLAILGYALAGYPLFFASFEKVGESITDNTVRPFEEVDDTLTEWLTSCWSDVFIIIKDLNPVDTSDLYRLKRFAQQSRTTGSFLTDYPLHMTELADDVSVHCKAPLKKIDIYATYPIEQELNQRRTYYVEFDATDRVEKSEVLEKILSRLTSPFVTIIYASSFQVGQPILSHIEPDPKRDAWSTSYVDYHAANKFKKPVVAPLLNEAERERRSQPKAQLREHQEALRRAAQFKEILSDKTFAVLFMVAVVALVMKLLWDALGFVVGSFKAKQQPQKRIPKLVEPLGEPADDIPASAKTTESEL